MSYYLYYSIEITLSLNNVPITNKDIHTSTVIIIDIILVIIARRKVSFLGPISTSERE